MNNNSISRVSETDWEALDKMTDDEIDLSDIPEVTAEQMVRAKLRVGGKPISKGKVRVNIYLDVEVIEYFRARAGGRGYQTLINETLKESIQYNRMEEILRRVIREELQVQEWGIVSWSIYTLEGQLSHGQWGGRPPDCHAQTGLNPLALSGFSVTGSLTKTAGVDQVVTVAV